MDEKKKYILKTVGSLYMKHGIKSVTMDDIASNLGMSKKTLYRYFKDKEHMTEQVVDFYLAYNGNDCSFEKSENAIDQFIKLREKFAEMLASLNSNIEFELKRAYPRLHDKIVNYKKRRIYNDTVSNLNKGVSNGYYRSNLDIDFIAKLIMGRYINTLNPDNNIFSEKELMSIDLFDKLNDYHLHAICTKKGIEYYKKQINKVRNEYKI